MPFEMHISIVNTVDNILFIRFYILLHYADPGWPAASRDTMLPRRSFFCGSRFVLEKSRETSRHPVAAAFVVLFTSPRDRAHERETETRVCNKTRRSVFSTLLSLFLSPTLHYLRSLFLRSYPALFALPLNLLLSNGGTGINLYAVRVCTPLFLAIPRNLQETSRTLWRLLA